jgi:flagellar assembly protein FliH
VTAATRPATILGRDQGGISVRRRPRERGVPIDYAVLSGDPTPEDLASDYQAAFDAGYADGRSAAQAETEDDLRQARLRAVRALEALERGTEEVAQAFAGRQRQLEHSLPRFAYELVETLIGRELQLSTAPGRDAIARALAIDDSGLPATVRLHPEDVEGLGDVAELGGARTITLIADPSVEPGGALVDVGEATIDSQLSTALQRVRDLLFQEGLEVGR